MEFGYKKFFERNYGILTGAEQERIRKTTVFIAGDTGTAETIAIILARSGTGNFIIAGDAFYEASDMNRQPGCFADMTGQRKRDCIKDAIVRINPDAGVELIDGMADEAALESAIEKADIIIPSTDDLPVNVYVFRTARRLKKPAVLCLPSGTAAWISVFTEKTITIEDALGVPAIGHKKLDNVIRSGEYKCAQYNFITEGDWKLSWFRQYFLGQKPLALICPVVMTASALAAIEALKVISGKWEPIYAPKCWQMKRGRIYKTSFSRFIRWHRKLGWYLFGSDEGIRNHGWTMIFWKSFFRYLEGRRRD